MKNTRHWSARLFGAMAAAMAIVLSGCGDSDTPTTEDTTPPAVTITGVSSTALATKDYVTITFTFSEAIDSATFTAATPTVTNGTKGSFTRTSTSVCTLQVAPNDGQGTMTIAVAVGAFKDVAGNANTLGASVDQPYDITPPKPSLPITFDSALVTYSATGAATVAVTADPDTSQTTNKAAKVSIPANAGGWPGATFQLATAVPVGTSAISVRVYSPGPGHYVGLKLAGDAPSADDTGDVLAKTTALANKWDTLVFRFPPLKAALNNLTIIPDFKPAGLAANNPAEDVYIDTIRVALDLPINFETFASATDYVPSAQMFPSDGAGPPTIAIVNDPYAAAGSTATKVLKITRTASMEVWAGFYFVPATPIPGGTTTVSMRVYSTAPGINFNVKLEGDNGQTGDVKVATTKTNEWETLLWDYSKACGGTACGSLASAHSKLTVIPDHSDAAKASAGDYYIDDIKVFGIMPMDFEAPIAMDGSFPSDAGIIPPGSARVQDPDNKGNNTVLLIRRFSSDASWGGVFFVLTKDIIPAGTAKVSMKVKSPGPGKKFSVKLEGGTVNTGDCNVATTAAAGTWETLTWDYSAGGALCSGGPAAVSSAHSVVTIMPDTDGDGAGHATDADYYVDDVQIVP